MSLNKFKKKTLSVNFPTLNKGILFLFLFLFRSPGKFRFLGIRPKVVNVWLAVKIR